MDILFIILACVISAILYRAGGMSKDDSAQPKWIPKWLRRSWVRDCGCSLTLVGLSMLLYGISGAWWGYLLCFGLSWAALSTYWDSLFGYDNFWFSGFVCGLAGLPLLMCGVPWQVLVARIVIVTIGWGAWSAIVSRDVGEEMGRGALFIA